MFLLILSGKKMICTGILTKKNCYMRQTIKAQWALRTCLHPFCMRRAITVAASSPEVAACRLKTQAESRTSKWADRHGDSLIV